MKRIYIITILAVICGMTAMAQNRPDMAHQNTGRDRGGFAFHAIPIITYNDYLQQLTIVSNNVDAFELTITSVATHEIKIQESFEGSSATINVSFLDNNGVYLIEFLGSDGTTYMTEFVKTASWTDSSVGTRTDLLDLIINGGEQDRLQRK